MVSLFVNIYNLRFQELTKHAKEKIYLQIFSS